MDTLAGGRSRRQVGVSSAKTALAQLAELKKTGVKRSAQFEVRRPSVEGRHSRWPRRGAVTHATPLAVRAGYH